MEILRPFRCDACERTSNHWIEDVIPEEDLIDASRKVIASTHLPTRWNSEREVVTAVLETLLEEVGIRIDLGEVK